MSDPSARRFAWAGFACALPDGWEATAYRIGERDGEARFHHRLRPMARLAWSRLAKPPDVEHRLLHAASGAKEPRSREHGPGFLLTAEDRPMSAAAWLAGRSLLVSLDASGPDIGLAPLLDGLAEAPQGREERSVCGLRSMWPADAEHIDLDAFPADIRLHGRLSGGMHVRIRRIGLPRLHLAGRGLRAFLRAAIDSDRGGVLETRDEPFRGQPGAWALVRRRGERGPERLLGRWWRGEARCWHDEQARRITIIEQVGPRTAVPLDIADAIPA